MKKKKKTDPLVTITPMFEVRVLRGSGLAAHYVTIGCFTRDELYEFAFATDEV